MIAAEAIFKLYRFLFARKCFFRLNRLIYRCSLSGMGVLNYESSKVSGEELFLKSYLKGRSDAVVFDVGANAGEYSRLVRQSCASATVYAFEPHPKTFRILTESISDEAIYPVNAAVGRSAGVVSLYDYAGNDGSHHASLYRDVIENIHRSPAVEHQVSVISLDEFAKNKAISHVDLLKIDTEGNEFLVLQGFATYIKSGRVHAIHFEFNEMNVSSRTYFRDFWEFMGSYEFYRLLPQGMLKIDKYVPLFCEIFAYQNIVAILKVPFAGEPAAGLGEPSPTQ